MNRGSLPGANGLVRVEKDASRELPVPSAWRASLAQIVDCIRARDYVLQGCSQSVTRPARAVSQQISEYVADYGETLLDLPEETWESSVVIWMGDHWDVLVDLWTVESGQSDMVLFVHVSESSGTQAYRFEVVSVHVP